MSDAMTEAADQEDDKDQQEPTMEEILASIRRIISEDGEPVEEGEDVPEEEEVLELTNVVAESDAEPAEQVALDDGAAAVPEPAPEPEPVPQPEPAPAPQPTGEVPAFADTLVSAGTAHATTGAFAGMTTALHDSRGLPLGHNKTLEDIVKELLRPMLKEWLDANLTPMVQRIVEREVSKLAGRAEDET